MLWNIYIAKYEVSYEVPKFNHLLVIESLDTICDDYSNTNRGWRQILENVRYKICKTLEVIPDDTNGGLCNKVYILISEIMEIIVKFSDNNKEYPVNQPTFDIFKSKIKAVQDKLNDFLTGHHISITYEFKVGFRGLVPYKNEQYEDSLPNEPDINDYDGILNYLGYDRKQYAIYRLTEIRSKVTKSY